MARDYYEDTVTICSLLKHDGFENVAEQLTNVVTSGSVGSEILMGLRHHSSNFLSTGQGSDTTRGRIAEFISALDQALR